MDKSKLFKYYNIAKSAGVFNGLDEARVDRALGLLQRKDGGQKRFDRYETSIGSCKCGDSTIRKQVCFHRIAKMILRKIEIESEQPETKQIRKSREQAEKEAHEKMIAEINAKAEAHRRNRVYSRKVIGATVDNELVQERIHEFLVNGTVNGKRATS